MSTEVTSNSLRAYTLMKLSNIYIFSIKHSPNFLHLGTTRQQFSSTFGGHLKQWNLKQKISKKQTRNIALNRQWKYVNYESRKRKSECKLVWTQMGICMSSNSHLLICTCLWMTSNVHEYWFWVKNCSDWWISKYRSIEYWRQTVLMILPGRLFFPLELTGLQSLNLFKLSHISNSQSCSYLEWVLLVWSRDCLSPTNGVTSYFLDLKFWGLIW